MAVAGLLWFAGLLQGLAQQAGARLDVGAVEVMRRNAEAGDASAQVMLAELLARGMDVPKDEAAAASWYRRSAEGGNQLGQYLIGIAMFEGSGVPKDEAGAAAWFQKAAATGNPEAHRMLGDMHAQGVGVAKDDAKAAGHFHEAAFRGSAAAQHRLGLAFRDGVGVRKSLLDAYCWLLLAGAGSEDARKDMGGVERMLTPGQRKACQAWAKAFAAIP